MKTITPILNIGLFILAMYYGLYKEEYARARI